MDNIKRREALKRAAWIMGGVLSAPTLAGVLNGCSPRPELTWVPAFFTEDQARLVMEASETILPETDTPGAKTLGVPGFIEEMVGKIYSENYKNSFLKGLDQLARECRDDMGQDFVSLSKEKRNEFLTKKNEEIKGLNFKRGEKQRPFFWMLKELTLVGYYTTEYGATQALQYMAIPTQWEGCLPLVETGNGKTWATS